MRFQCIVAALATVLCFLATESRASSYSGVVVYGDSLSDNGNLFMLAGYPGAPYYDGRRSDGPVAVEYLAQALGVPLLDFAVIGATTGIGNFADGGSVTQPGASVLPGMTNMFASTKDALGSFIADGLFVVWGGPNDVLAPSAEDATPYPQAIVTRAVNNELAIINELLAMGAHSILVPGMPDLGLTPYFQSLGAVDSATGTAISDAFNARLQEALPQGVLFFDTAALMRSVVSEPGAYGFANVADACFDGSQVCADPSQYLFFDDFHPTTATHAIIGRGFVATVVPEPSTLLLFCAGCGLLALVRRRHTC